MNDQNKPADKEQDKQSAPTMAPSAADEKNRPAGEQASNPVSRVKPQSGDGLANEGTVVDYTEER